MNRYGLKFHHLGLAVKKHEKAVEFLRANGYEIGDIVHDPMQRVNLIYCKGAEMPDVEIIFSTEEQNPLGSILSNRSEIIYHTCYETENIGEAVNKMTGDGFMVFEVSPPKPAPLFGEKKVGFYMVKGFGLIELLETL